MCALLCVAFSPSLSADPIEDFYRGKTLTVISGFSPSGENDTYLRIMGRHIARYIPGHPTIVISNMTGAGTMIAANHLYNKAVADGTVLGMFTSQVAADPFLGNKLATFDPLKFGWIGSITQDQQFCAVAPGPGVPETFQELRTKETVFGSSATGSDIYRLNSVIKNALGAKIRIVSGYAGMPAVILAMQRGEVAGTCGFTVAALRSNLADSLKSGRMKLLVQMGRSLTTEFGNVPSVFDFATEGSRDIVEFYFHGLAIGRPIAAPPNVPSERLSALRTAFNATLKDKEFVEEAKKLNLIINPVSGAEIEDQMARLSKYPAEFYQRVKEAVD
jgi:tripartite-type tricarboxylate transporter receptor subunit TctC